MNTMGANNKGGEIPRLNNSSEITRRTLLIGLFGATAAALTGCGGSAKGEPAPVATATETSPSPTGAETTTPSATPSVTPRPTETPKPSPSPTAETASPSPETPKTPPEIGSIEDVRLLEKVAEKMRKMSDAEWNSLSEKEQAKLVSAMIQDNYIECFIAFEPNSPPFDNPHPRGRIIGDIGKDPQPTDVAIQPLMALQAALAAKTGKTIASDDGKTKFHELDTTTARRMLEFFTPYRNYLEKLVERGVVTTVATLPEHIGVLDFNQSVKDGERRVVAHLNFDWGDRSAPKGLRVGDNVVRGRVLDCKDYAERPLHLLIFEPDGIPDDLFGEYFSIDPAWKPIRSSKKR